jgi:hypothetical protein
MNIYTSFNEHISTLHNGIVDLAKQVNFLEHNEIETKRLNSIKFIK